MMKSRKVNKNKNKNKKLRIIHYPFHLPSNLNKAGMHEMNS